MSRFVTQVQTTNPPFHGVSSRFARRVLAALAVILVSNLTTDNADASCGNYLFRNGLPVSGHQMPAQTDPPVSAAESAVPPAPVLPCRGPNCSRSPVPAMPVPAPVQVSPLSDAAVLSRSDSRCSCGIRQVDVPQSESGAFFEPGSVFRPPAA